MRSFEWRRKIECLDSKIIDWSTRIEPWPLPRHLPHPLQTATAVIPPRIQTRVQTRRWRQQRRDRETSSRDTRTATLRARETTLGTRVIGAMGVMSSHPAYPRELELEARILIKLESGDPKLNLYRLSS